ncbi:hypothetical protein [Rhodopirellula sp. SWK7]|uniref:hypothetical protein n=1 Tax=Rhodopirellula sp. SWK7 TaxID=595460 RepID=UPI0002BDD3F0|nr:hypothetical protein [Rhodopirellula sp. SWK7]EMI44900.1 hypothetical protein RRSWK_02540 [Rhodopirellula sp. SWK7]
MSEKSLIELVVLPDGTTRSIYDERLDLKSVGSISIARASHVEPSPSGEWLADLSPVGGPITLGSFDKRSDALAAEVAWLQKNWLTRSDE